MIDETTKTELETEAPAPEELEQENTEQGEDLLDITDFVEEQKKLVKSERKMRDLEWFGLRALIFVIVVWALFYGLIGFATIGRNDMYPRVDAGDLLLFYRLDKDVRAQDIIVYNVDGERFVGRVVAIAGDTVEVTTRNTLVVNGNTLSEPNIFYPTVLFESDVEFPLTLGEDECFVLGDKRDEAVDSRVLGPISKDEIAGTVITILRRNNL